MVSAVCVQQPLAYFVAKCFISTLEKGLPDVAMLLLLNLIKVTFGIVYVCAMNMRGLCRLQRVDGWPLPQRL